MIAAVAASYLQITWDSSLHAIREIGVFWSQM